MAKSGTGGKRRGQDPDDDWDSNLIRALNHRIRRRILRVLQTADGPRSPARIAEVLGVPLSNVSYHIKVLVDFQTVKMVDEQQGLGNIQHFYESIVKDNATIHALLETTRETDEG